MLGKRGYLISITALTSVAVLGDEGLGRSIGRFLESSGKDNLTPENLLIWALVTVLFAAILLLLYVLFSSNKARRTYSPAVQQGAPGEEGKLADDVIRMRSEIATQVEEPPEPEGEAGYYEESVQEEDNSPEQVDNGQAPQDDSESERVVPQEALATAQVSGQMVTEQPPTGQQAAPVQQQEEEVQEKDLREVSVSQQASENSELIQDEKPQETSVAQETGDVGPEAISMQGETAREVEGESQGNEPDQRSIEKQEQQSTDQQSTEDSDEDYEKFVEISEESQQKLKQADLDMTIKELEELDKLVKSITEELDKR